VSQASSIRSNDAKRIFLAGLAAGGVLTMLNAVINIRLLGLYGLYGHAWVDATSALGVTPNSLAVGSYWGTMCFASGIVQVWLYAATRPRFVSNGTTAIVTGLLTWFLIHMGPGGDAVSGVFPARLIAPVSILELFTTVAASWVGGRCYEKLAAQ
jgi:hypothetical protein